VERILAILFDWDGTLLDSYASGFRATMTVFQHYGIPADRQRFLATYSPNWYETYRLLGLAEDKWEAADRLWLQTYAQEPPDLYPFARETLATLAEHGYTLGLVTSGNRERVAEEIARHGLGELLSTLVCFEDTREKKPHPAPLLAALESLGRRPAEAAYVGDRPEDIMMGKSTGSYSIAVESEYGTRQVLEEALPDLLLPNAGHLTRRFGPRGD
jgi:HAD superfamily hydrolase (TIGR01509 family)